MTSVKVGGGTVTITDETIEIDIGPFGALKRLHEQNKLIVPFLIIGLLITAESALFESSPLRELGRFAIILAILTFILGPILPELRNSIKYASKTSRTTIHRVEYTTGSRLFTPKIRIIVDDSVVTGVRPIPLSHRRLGGNHQLEDAIQAFEDNGIDIVPADGDS